MSNSKKNYAVIDVGTLKSKFEIRSFDEELHSEVIYKDKKLTVLGRDLDKTDNMIIEKSILVTIEALKEFVEKMKEFNVVSYKAVTTEAIRKAKNSNEVLERIKKETGVELVTLSQKEEAELYFKSVSSDFPGQIIATADIGGGSVQVVIGKDDEIYEVHMFKTGTYYIQEEFSKTHHPTEQELQNAINYIDRELKSLEEVKYKPEVLVYGTTNIIDFLKAMNVDLKENKDKFNHPYYIDVSELKPVYDEIVKYAYEDRMKMYPEEPYYMWSADTALMNIFKISDSLKVPTIVPSNNNISSGILFELAKNNE